MKHLSTEILDLLLDEQLASAERASVQAHIAECAECRAELAVQRRIFTALDTLTEEPIPADLAPRVIAQIVPARRGWWVDGLLVVQIVTVAVLGVWLLPSFDVLLDDGLSNLSALTTILEQIVAEIAFMLEPVRVEPIEGIAPLEWAMLLGATGIIWVGVNLLLIADTRRVPPGRRFA